MVKKGGFILIDDVKNPQPKEKGERSDNGTAKFAVLSQWATAFEEKHNRKPSFWFDKVRKKQQHQQHQQQPKYVSNY